jgi:hypothetical protein
MGVTKSQREGKRRAAEARQTAYNSLTLEQKLAKAGDKVKAKLLKKDGK